MLKITTYLMLLCSLIASQSFGQQSGNERPATLQFLQGNWKVDETQLLFSSINKDGKTEQGKETIEGHSYEVLSIKDNGQMTEYGNPIGRKYPNDFEEHVGEYVLMDGSYTLGSFAKTYIIRHLGIRG